MHKRSACPHWTTKTLILPWCTKASTISEEEEAGAEEMEEEKLDKVDDAERIVEEDGTKAGAPALKHIKLINLQMHSKQ